MDNCRESLCLSKSTYFISKDLSFSIDKRHSKLCNCTGLCNIARNATYAVIGSSPTCRDSYVSLAVQNFINHLLFIASGLPLTLFLLTSIQSCYQSGKCFPNTYPLLGWRKLTMMATWGLYKYAASERLPGFQSTSSAGVVEGLGTEGDNGGPRRLARMTPVVRKCRHTKSLILCLSLETREKAEKLFNFLQVLELREVREERERERGS